MPRLLLALALFAGCQFSPTTTASQNPAPSPSVSTPPKEAAVARETWAGDYTFDESEAPVYRSYHLRLEDDLTGALDADTPWTLARYTVRGVRAGDRLAVIATGTREQHSATSPVVGDTLFALESSATGETPGLVTHWNALTPLLASTPRPGPAFRRNADPADWAMSERGAGELKIGVTMEEAAAAGIPLQLEEFVGECSYAQPYDGPFGLWAMIIGDQVARIDASDGSRVRMNNGLGIGSTTAETRQVYGDRMAAEPHKYTDGQYLNVDLGDGRMAVFETDEAGVVVAYRVGRVPEVHYVEGCL